MHIPLFLVGKRLDLVLLATSTLGLSPSCLFFIMDRASRLRFLVDTGAEVSVIPPSHTSCTSPSTGPSLQAASQSPIATYGVHPLCLNLGLCRPFRWSFIVADVKHPILGANFLGHFNLRVDITRHRLVDNVPSCRSMASHPRNPCPVHQCLAFTTPADFPSLLRPPPPYQLVKHSVTHHVSTTSPPVTFRPRRLPPERLKIARQEFNRMLDLGIIRPSSSC